MKNIKNSDMRHFDIYDVLIEFKYVTLDDAGLSGEKKYGNLLLKTFVFLKE